MCLHQVIFHTQYISSTNPLPFLTSSYGALHVSLYKAKSMCLLSILPLFLRLEEDAGFSAVAKNVIHNGAALTP